MLSSQKEVSSIFLKLCQQGRMPWQGTPLQAPEPLLLPHNEGTGKSFTALNTLLLWNAARTAGYPSVSWATADAWQAQDGIIAEGQQTVKLYHFEENQRQSLGWTTHVFNRCQLQSNTNAAVKTPKLKALSTRLTAVQDFIAATGANIESGGDYPVYFPDRDIIRIPPLQGLLKHPTQEEEERHYASLLYPLMHWTGKPQRCKREMTGRLFSQGQLFESLVALIGSTMLAARFQIRVPNRIGGCDFSKALVEVIGQDELFFISAASEADRALEFLNATTRFALDAKYVTRDKRSTAQLLHANQRPTQIIPLPAARVPQFRA